jgi:hypothetical protein
MDWTASFSLNIPGVEGTFIVPEGGSFSLPYDPEAAKKPYKFKSKKENKIEIEYDKGGKKSTIELDIPAVK